MWELLDMKKYASMSMQYSRGCPYDCEFCDITVLYGRMPRTKTVTQVINELENIDNQVNEIRREIKMAKEKLNS